MSRARLNLNGQRFGGLVVINRVPASGASQFACLCDCGRKKIVAANNLRKGKTRSCGCLFRSSRALRHGDTKKGATTPEYTAWTNMRNRCSNPTCKDWKNYGGRGIRVCWRWQSQSGFVLFLADVGRRPSAKHSIDRINNDGHYEPGNCRWATKKEQQNNQRPRRRRKQLDPQQTFAFAA